MTPDEAIREATGRKVDPPMPGALLVVQEDGTVAALLGTPGQQLVIGDDGMPAYVDGPAPAGGVETAPVDSTPAGPEIAPEPVVPDLPQTETPIIDAIETAVAVGRHRAPVE